MWRTHSDQTPSRRLLAIQRECKLPADAQVPQYEVVDDINAWRHKHQWATHRAPLGAGAAGGSLCCASAAFCDPAASIRAHLSVVSCILTCHALIGDCNSAMINNKYQTQQTPVK